MSWSVLQSNRAGPQSGIQLQNNPVTFTSNLSAGTVMFAFVSLQPDGGANSIASVADGSGNNFTQIASFEQSDDNQLCAIWALATPAGDVGTKPTITATPASLGHHGGILVQEVSGIQAVADGTAGSLGGVNTVLPTTTGSPTYSSSAANEYLVSVYGDHGKLLTITQPAGMTLDPSSVSASGTFNDFCVAYANSAGGAESTSWGQANAGGGTGVSWVVITVAFKLPPVPAAKVTASGVDDRPLMPKLAMLGW